MELLEQAQRRVMELERELEQLSCEVRLGKLELFSLEMRRFGEDLIANFQHVEELQGSWRGTIFQEQ